MSLSALLVEKMPLFPQARSCSVVGSEIDLVDAPCWGAAARHRWRAGARLRLAVLAVVAPERAPEGAVALEALVSDAILRSQIRMAMTRAAQCVGLASATDVVAIIDGLAEECAVIEALRERLLAPMQALVRDLAAESRRSLARPGDPAAHRRDQQRGRVAVAALGDVCARLGAADSVTEDILQVLRAPATACAVLRSHRDGLIHAERRYLPLLEPAVRAAA